jgi:D-tyrosyl-tRNA(Tyr) deacylase
LVSCNANISGFTSPNHANTCGKRTRKEFTFQVAILKILITFHALLLCILFLIRNDTATGNIFYQIQGFFMLALIQRVSAADVKVNNQIIGAIQHGILALIGIEKTDTQQKADKLLAKITTYRIFDDADGKMNLNLTQIKGELLLVPQFTLVADTHSGTRPGFSNGMSPKEAAELFSYMVAHAKTHYSGKIASGEFGAEMKVNLCNDGPVTFILQIK